jgi:hypothetical protein
VPVGLTIVTEARIAEPGVADQLNAWLSIICNAITEKHFHLLETSHLFLEIHRDSGSCNYYFADHTLRTVFWLHTLDTLAVGVPPQHSFKNSHLQYALEENYWTHVGLFPEAASQYSVQALNELQVVLLHDARADALTSDTPTFPYTVDQREEIIDVLERNKDRAHSSPIITHVARLWTSIASHRSLIHFGEDHCRLSFGQSTNSNWSFPLAMISNTLLFGFPDGRRARFKRLWLDKLVNTSRWREHISETVEDSKQTMSSMFALLIANVLMMPLSSFPAFSSSSLLLCVLGLVTTLFLMQEQRRILATNATAAAVRLGNPNAGYRFRQIAIVHSLPQALFTWALLLFAMQSFWLTFAHFPFPMLSATFLPVATVLVVACGGIWKALHPRPKNFEDATPAVDQIEHLTEYVKLGPAKRASDGL